jgi:hypothetical protein
MRKNEVNERIRKSSVKVGSVILAATVVFGSSMYALDSRVSVPELTTVVDTDEAVEIEKEETPLAAPKVTKSTKVSKKTKKIKMKKASKKTYNQSGKTTTTKNRKTQKAGNTTTTTETVQSVGIVNQYKKGSNIDTQVTTTKTTVTKTTVTAATKTVTTASTTVTDTNPDVDKIAPKVDDSVIKAYKKLGFTVKINTSVSYSGLFDARSRSITLKKSDDTIYHELGHFVAFLAGNMDVSSGFKKVYASEKSSYTAYNKSYVLTNSSEYFAESFKNYTLDPQSLKKERPETYAAIETAMSKITDAQISKIAKVYSAIWK